MNLEMLKAQIMDAVAGCTVEVIANPSVSAQHSLLVRRENAVAIATYLRDDAELSMDYCSNVTGIDWPAREISETVKVSKTVDGIEQTVDEIRKMMTPAYLEAVYHLYSMSKGHGPLILRMRTVDRKENVHLPSLTPVWRSCDFQEREIFDLFGVVFDGHPDLRRLLMWDGFLDHPMRKDYVEPDDYEYEPTAHDEVLRKTNEHHGRTA
jgi:NADH-quinone oxidoreductase subunit C